MRASMARVLAALVAGALLVGCGGQGGQGGQGEQGGQDAAEASGQAEGQGSAARQGADGVVDVGEYVFRAEDGKVVMPGFTFILPDDIAQGDYNVAGWARIDFKGMWGRIWIYDPEEDLASQVTKPGFFEIEGVPAGKTMKEALAELKELGEDVPEGAEDCYIDLGENAAYHYYAIDVDKASELFEIEDEDYSQYGIDQERIDIAKSLEGRRMEYVECFEPTDMELPAMQHTEDVDAKALADVTLEDLDGNKVRLGDVFAKNRLTMIDIWKTDCGPCIEGMPDLEKLYQDMRDRGFAVLGVNCDVLDGSDHADEFLLEDARDIVESTGVTYPTVLADSKFLDIVYVYATPTTLFVDSEGNVVEGPSAGSYPADMLSAIVESKLDSVS